MLNVAFRTSWLYAAGDGNAVANMRAWMMAPEGAAEEALRFAGVFALFMLLTGLLFWPWMAHLSSSLI